MKFRFHLCIVFALISNLCIAQDDHSNNTLLLKNASYLDLDQMKFVKGNILIQGQKIEDLDANYSSYPNVPIIDASDKFIIPGLIDAHIHLFQSGGIYTRPDAIDLTEFKPYEEERNWLRENAGDLLKRYLRCGITSVVDIGGPMSNYGIRDQYNDQSNYPNLFITGPLVSTYQPPAFNIEDSPIIKVNTPEEARELVRKQVPLKPDFIKIWGIPIKGISEKDMFDIMSATANESAKNNLRLAVHATDLNSAKLAVKAGADFLVHSVSNPIDNEFIEMVLENDVVYIPTLIVGGNYSKSFSLSTIPSKEDFEISNPFVLGTLFDGAHLTEVAGFKYYKSNYPKILANNKNKDSIAFDNLRKLLDAGVTIATGTDAGNIGTLHASSFYDEVAKMKVAGLDNKQLLLSSTLNGAKVVNAQNDIGSIEKGKFADLVILKNNPLNDINALKDISHVIKNGKVHEVDDILIDTPEMLAQRQLNAYNARDIEAFLEPYAENVKLFTFPDQLNTKGKANMRNNYAAFFENTPDLHCELVNRMVLGNTVIDQERVTGLQNNNIIEAIAIYKIINSKIAEVYFIRK